MNFVYCVKDIFRIIFECSAALDVESGRCGAHTALAADAGVAAGRCSARVRRARGALAASGRHGARQPQGLLSCLFITFCLE